MHRPTYAPGPRMRLPKNRPRLWRSRLTPPPPQKHKLFNSMCGLGAGPAPHGRLWPGPQHIASRCARRDTRPPLCGPVPPLRSPRGRGRCRRSPTPACPGYPMLAGNTWICAHTCGGITLRNPHLNSARGPTIATIQHHLPQGCMMPRVSWRPPPIRGGGEGGGHHARGI